MDCNTSGEGCCIWKSIESFCKILLISIWVRLVNDVRLQHPIRILVDSATIYTQVFYWLGTELPRLTWSSQSLQPCDCRSLFRCWTTHGTGTVDLRMTLAFLFIYIYQLTCNLSTSGGANKWAVFLPDYNPCQYVEDSESVWIGQPIPPIILECLYISI